MVNWTESVVDSEFNPVPGVRVWVTTDIAGRNVTHSGVTDGDGFVEFKLWLGTQYFWFDPAYIGPDIDQPIVRNIELSDPYDFSIVQVKGKKSTIHALARQYTKKVLASAIKIRDAEDAKRQNIK